MNNFARFSVFAPAETVLKKLAKAEIPAYNLKKCGNRLSFSVRDEYRKKVFAIFVHSCYNIKEETLSPARRAVRFVKNRFGLIVGCALFVAAAFVSQSFVFKVEVTGSGSHLYGEVVSILNECGVSVGKFFGGVDKPYVEASVLALPDVTFCSFEKSGSVVRVDVRCDREHKATAFGGALKSEVNGKILNVVAVCGTAEVSVGDTVGKGDVIISPYELSEDGQRSPCLAVGYAEIECEASVSYSADCESEENGKAACASALLYAENSRVTNVSVKANGEGVTYEISIAYARTLSINMD